MVEPHSGTAAEQGHARPVPGDQGWIVGVHVSDAEGARRERQRGGRVDGANRGSARATHALVDYDFEIDTTETVKDDRPTVKKPLRPVLVP